MLNQFCQITFPPLWVSITTISKGMYKHLLNTCFRHDVGQCMQVFLAAVYTTMGNKPEEVNLFVVFLSISDGLNQLRVLTKGFISDCEVDLNQILVNDSTSTNIKVTYFGVTHLSVGKSNVLA